MAAIGAPDDAPGAFGRPGALDRLGSTRFDVLVIGGGITGAGVALDAASRGLSTALVEKGDFASGTSSKSSKLVHGGIRYLQQREFKLVYENLAERQLLFDAPHLVTPLPFLIPLFGRHGVVSKTVARSYATALWLYDLTGGLRIGARHRRVTKQEALAHLPLLSVDHLVAGFLYFDAQTDDARLTMTVLRTAVLEHGAVAANYAPVTGLRHQGGRVVGADVEAKDHGPLSIQARVVVNATGVWADRVAGLDANSPVPLLRPAKGVHITVPADRMPADIGAVIPVPKDRRSIFVVPWREGGLVYIGTTDTEYSGSIEEPSSTPDDVEYLLSAVNLVTSANLRPTDVTGVWAGLRPLLAPTSGHHLSDRTADLSRRHTVSTSTHGLVTVTGGKLTTYRKMAEDTVDQALRVLGDGAKRPSVTAHLRLRGAGDMPPAAPGWRGLLTSFGKSQAQPGSPAAAADEAGSPRLELGPDVHRHLRSRYGSDASEVLGLADQRPELLQPIVEGLPYLGAEIIFAARHEMAQTLDDVLSRRTRARIERGRETAAATPQLARLLGEELGWDEERMADEAQRCSQQIIKELERAGLGSGGTVAAERHNPS